MDLSKYPILVEIGSPEDLKKLPESSLEPLAGEIREFLIENLQKTGGHLASNLGVVELSIALHRVFSSPHDHIIWDVGHQCYTHKMLTGRAELFEELRVPGGLSGFTKRSESEHDPFGCGHSATSLSASLGFAFSDRMSQNEAFTVAVIGDGAFTGGMVSEALNNIDPSLPFLIVFNENEMAISKNVGAFSRYISNIRSTKKYFRFKKGTKSLLSGTALGTRIANGLRRVKKGLKNRIYGSNYFENIGLKYYGPIDGNDISKVTFVLEEAKARRKSAVIHLKTVKGFGYAPAIDDPELFHIVYPGKKCDKTFSQVFGDKLLSLAKGDPDICAISAAMTHGCGLDSFVAELPERLFDVGIAEAHAVTFAAGLAASGKKPIVAIYSSFLQRAYDSILHDVALQGLPVVFAIDRAGLAPADGPTHHGIYDVSFLSGIPGMSIYAPISFESLERMLEEAVSAKAPIAIRYPAGSQDNELISALRPTPSGILEYSIDRGCDALVVTYGRIASEAKKAIDILADEGMSCRLAVIERLCPYESSSKDLISYIKALPGDSFPIFFLEEGVRSGGFAMNVYERIREDKELAFRKFRILAIDGVGASEKGKNLYESCRIDAGALVYNIKEESTDKK